METYAAAVAITLHLTQIVLTVLLLACVCVAVSMSRAIRNLGSRISAAEDLTTNLNHQLTNQPTCGREDEEFLRQLGIERERKGFN